MTVRIYTVSDKRPDFIELQYTGFRKYLKDVNFQFIVCNNGSTQHLKGEIDRICAQLGLITLYVPGNDENGAIATQTPLIYCINNYIANDRKNDISVIIDSDIFLFTPFSFESLLSKADIAGIYQQRDRQNLKIFFKTHYYLWNAFLVFRNSAVNFDDFDLSLIQNVTDVGGNTHYYLQKYHPAVNWLKHTADIEKKEKVVFDTSLQTFYDADFGMQIIENSFIHYYRGSNWDESPQRYHERKTSFLHRFLNFASTDSAPLSSQIALFQSDCEHTKKHFNGTRNNHRCRFNISNPLYRLKWF